MFRFRVHAIVKLSSTEHKKKKLNLEYKYKRWIPRDNSITANYSGLW